MRTASPSTGNRKNRHRKRKPKNNASILCPWFEPIPNTKNVGCARERERERKHRPSLIMSLAPEFRPYLATDFRFLSVANHFKKTGCGTSIIPKNVVARWHCYLSWVPPCSIGVCHFRNSIIWYEKQKRNGRSTCSTRFVPVELPLYLSKALGRSSPQKSSLAKAFLMLGLTKIRNHICSTSHRSAKKMPPVPNASGGSHVALPWCLNGHLPE